MILTGYLTPNEVAERYGVTRRTIDRWLLSGRLPYRRVGGRVRVHPDWLRHIDSGDPEPTGANSQTASVGPVTSTNPAASGSAYIRGDSR